MTRRDRRKEGTKRVPEAKSTDVVWKTKDEVRPNKIFDLEDEDDKFLRNFNILASV